MKIVAKIITTWAFCLTPLFFTPNAFAYIPSFFDVFTAESANENPIAVEPFFDIFYDLRYRENDSHANSFFDVFFDISASDSAPPNIDSFFDIFTDLDLPQGIIWHFEILPRMNEPQTSLLDQSVQMQNVPEPSSLGLMVLGMVALRAIRKKLTLEIV